MVKIFILASFRMLGLNQDLMHVVFLTANVQHLNDYGLLQAVEDSGDKKKSPKK
jgi:hypothetical protein